MSCSRIVLAFISAISFFGCATNRSLITPENLERSQVEIISALGHSQYKYVAIGSAETAEVSIYRDERVIETRVIPLEKYQDFAKRLEHALRSAPSSDVDVSCRTPYKITITIDDRQNTTSGCRSADSDGNIGQLLKEGEFIFYSAESSEPPAEEQTEEQAEDSQLNSRQKNPASN